MKAFLTILLAAALPALAYDISGIAVDPSGEPLGQATVRVLRPDSTFVAGTSADVEGHFSVKGLGRGRYIVEATYIGLDKACQDVSLTDRSITLPKPLTLHEGSVRLAEVEVRGVRTPMKVMTDTVEFSADSYLTRPNAAVEDLLKRLPGVEVDKEGKITANGKEVAKILVDGQEFFGDDPKVASKNLPVDMVEKLQVIDRKSSLARLTGVDDGEDETVINLTVKKDMRNGWFGSAEAGYGTDSRYLGSFNISRFQNSNQFTLLGNFNNINELGFTDGNGNRFRRFGGSQGITTSQAVGANFNVGTSEKLRFGGDVMYSHSVQDTRKAIDRQYLFEDSTSYYNSFTRTRDKGDNLRADFRLKWDPDSFNLVEFRPNLSLNFNRSTQLDSALTRAGDAPRTLVNRTFNDAASRGRSFEGGARLIYTHNFKARRGRSISFMVNWKSSNVHDNENTFTSNRFYLLDDELEEYSQYQRQHTWSHTLRGRVSWTEPLGDVKNGNFLVAAYHITHRWNNADKNVWQDDEYLGELSNSFRNRFLTQQLRLGYKKVTRALNAEAGVTLVPSSSSSDNLSDPAKTIATRHTFYVAPFARLNWKITKNRSFNFNYRSRSSEPSMSQLQPVADRSDPLRIVQGNPNLAPSFTHYIMARFQDFNPDEQRSLMAMAHFNATSNSIVSRTTYDATTGGQLTTYENVNGVWSGRAMCVFSMPLRNKLWSFNNHFFSNFSRSVGFTEDVRTSTFTTALREQPALAFRPDGLELELRPYYKVQFTKVSVNTTIPTTVHNFGGTFYGSWYARFGLVLNSDLSFDATRGYSSGYDTDVWLWNASIAWQFLSDRSATISVKAHDLLNQTKSISRNVTNAYIEDIDVNQLTRYVMVTFSYKFNSFGKGREPKQEGQGFGPGGMRHGHPGPPPGGGGRPRF